MTPKQLVDALASSCHLVGLEVVDGPHAVSDTKTVVYLQDKDGSPRLRLEVTQ